MTTTCKCRYSKGPNEYRHPSGDFALACYMLRRAVIDLKYLRAHGVINGLVVNREWFKNGAECGDYASPEDVDALLEFFTSGVFADWLGTLSSNSGIQPSDRLAQLGFDPEKCCSKTDGGGDAN